MKNSIRTCFLAITLIIGFSKCNQPDESTKEQATTPMKEESREKELKHIVTFKFKEGTPTEEIEKINDAFLALPNAIPAIKSFDWGINDSPENFHQDFTHCYILTFASEYDRDSIYTPHERHQAFVASLQPYLEKVFVVDFWTNP